MIFLFLLANFHSFFFSFFSISASWLILYGLEPTFIIERSGLCLLCSLLCVCVRSFAFRWYSMLNAHFGSDQQEMTESLFTSFSSISFLDTLPSIPPSPSTIPPFPLSLSSSSSSLSSSQVSTDGGKYFGNALLFFLSSLVIMSISVCWQPKNKRKSVHWVCERRKMNACLASCCFYSHWQCQEFDHFLSSNMAAKRGSLACSWQANLWLCKIWIQVPQQWYLRAQGAP